MNPAAAIKRMLYRSLSLDAYLRVVSRMFFLCYDLGLGRRSEMFEYQYFLKNLVREDDVIVDIGANLGYYSYIFSRLARRGHVHAVEPVPQICNVLRRNLRGARNVTIYNCALGTEERDIVMGNDSASRSGYMGTGQNFVMDSVNAAPQHARLEFSARMRRGSELFAGLQSIDLIKCDIEGYEVVVMQEMAGIIDRHLPTVLIETGGEKREIIKRFFLDRGYEAFTLSDSRARRMTADDGKDIIFIHASRRERFQHLI